MDLTNKRVLIREDFNVPIENGEVQSDLRIRASLPGIQQTLAAGAQVSLISHLGRPEPGEWQEQYSLQPVATCLEKLLGRPVKFVKDIFNPQISPDDDLILYENVRFLPGETENSPELAKYLASLCDIFVMDAFGSAHRAHSSTVGVAEYAPIAIAGPLVRQEIAALDQIMQNPQHPVVAIIGGAKVSSKLEILTSLINIADTLIIGGGMANTLLAAQGYQVGRSLFELDLMSAAQKFLLTAQQKHCQILLPVDIITEEGLEKNLIAVTETDKIMDIGVKTIINYSKIIKSAKTILWNGPLGVFEDRRFANGTQQIAQAIADSKAFSVAGGGDTLAAIEQYNLSGQISYLSTGGGAFLEYIEGKKLPGIEILETVSRP